MNDRISAVEAYKSAPVTGNSGTVAGRLADVVETNFGRADGC
jgi:hypothetical protein